MIGKIQVTVGPPNDQPPERPDLQADGSLDVVHVWPTIQGEGPFQGEPAVFVRLAGCNLLCPGCDTDYTTDRYRVGVEKLRALVVSTGAWRVGKLVVITGGEPFRQNIGPLVRELLQSDCQVQIETNGTEFLEDFPYLGVTVVCSPKTGSVHPRLRPHVHALKYVLDAEGIDPEDGLPTSVLGNSCKVARPWEGFRGQVYVQPMDCGGDRERSSRNTKAAVEVCMKFGYRFCLQLHKYIGVD